MRRLAYLAAALALLAIAGIALVTTGTGLRLAARLALPLVPGQLEYTALDGRLIGPIELDGLRWRSAAGVLTAGRIELDWQPSRLASRHLYIDRIRAGDLSWQPAEAGPGGDRRETFEVPALPLAITVDDAEFDGLRIVQGDTTLAIDAVRFAAKVDEDRYRIESMRIESPLFDVEGAAALDVAAPNRLEIGLDWIARPAQLAQPLEGRFSAAGDAGRAEIELSTGGAFELAFAGSAFDLLTAPRLDGRLDIDRFDPAAFSEAKTGPIDGRLTLRLTAKKIGLDGRLRAPQLAPAGVDIALVAGLDADRVTLDKLEVRLQDRPTRLAASGTLKPDLSQLDLTLNWSDLAWPLEGDAFFSSHGGSGSVSGSISEYTFELDGKMAPAGAPTALVAIRGAGTSESISFTTFTARFDQGELTGNGKIDWSDLPAFQFLVASRDIDAQQWHEGLSGRFGFEASIAGSMPATGLNLTLDLTRLDGRINEQPLDGSGRFGYGAGTVRFSNLALRAGQARLEANGSLGDSLDLTWNVDIPDAGLFLPDVSGEIRSQGAARGQRNQPGLTGSLTLQDFSYGSYSAGNVAGRFEIGIEPGSVIDVELDASDLLLEGFQIASAKGSVSGTLGQHQIDLAAVGPAATVDATLRGGLDAQIWRGEIARLEAGRSEIGTWQLVDAAPVLAGRQRLELSNACLAQQASRLCASGTLSASPPWRFDFDLTDLPVATFEPFFPPGLVYEGAMTGKGHIASSTPAWAGEASLQLAGGRVIRREDDDDDVLIAAQTGTLEATFDPAKLQTRLKLDLRDAGLVDADITLPLQPDMPLRGTIQARLENLGLVTALVPQVSRIQGNIEAQLAVAGTLVNPDLSGTIGIRAAEVVLPDLGISLVDSTVDVTTAGNRIQFEADTRSHEGTLGVSGELSWLQGEPQGEIKIAGNAFRAVDLPEIWLDASPDVTLTVSGRDINVAGDIAVPAARITPVDISTGVGVSSDQVIVGQEKTSEASTKWRIGGRVQVSAGDAVSIAGYGLEGNLTGSVLVLEAPDQPTIGRGSLEIIDGRYRAYGQQLKIDTGRLEFTGGQIDDPGLNLQASRTSGDIVAGVQVRGALRRPVLTLYSVPPMSDTEAMSYLITGRGIEDLSEVDQTAVSDAATRLALRGGSALASSLGRGLGLDSVEFSDSGETASTSLVIGKHLSPRLFVSYGIGLFETLNTLRLRYHINSRLTIETQSGPATSADLLYSLER